VGNAKRPSSRPVTTEVIAVYASARAAHASWNEGVLRLP
jgi:hypothetical protein